jgi:hypothetical protein
LLLVQPAAANFGNFGHFPKGSGTNLGLIPGVNNPVRERWKNTTKIPKMFISLRTGTDNRRVRCDPGSTP